MSPLASVMLGEQQRMPPLASMVMANAGPAPSIDAASAPAPADAWSQNASAVQDWLAQQQAQSARMGLWNDQTGLPTQAGVMDAARQYANGMQPATIKAFHGSPYDFSAFDMSKIGSGEGAQAYGHGLYFAGNEGVAQSYKTAGMPAFPDSSLSMVSAVHPPGSPEYWPAAQRVIEGWINRNPNASASAMTQAQEALAAARNGGPGRMYEVNLNVEPGQLLDYDKPLAQQSPHVQQALTNLNLPQDPGIVPTDTGSGMLQKVHHSLYDYTTGAPLDNVRRSEDFLNSAGIPGIQYLDAGSRAAGDGTRNYVMFDPNLIDIVRKYGLAGAMLGAPAAAPFMQQQAPQQ